MKYLTYIVVFVLFFSCDSRIKYKKPKDLIAEAEMIDLLTDLHLGVGSLNIQDKNKERKKNYMFLVYQKYNIDSTRFAASNIYYMSDIEKYEDMFEEVKRRLDVLEDEYEIEKDTLEERARMMIETHGVSHE